MRTKILISARTAAVADSGAFEYRIGQGATATFTAFGLAGAETISIYAVANGAIVTPAIAVLSATEHTKQIDGALHIRPVKGTTVGAAGLSVKQ